MKRSLFEERDFHVVKYIFEKAGNDKAAEFFPHCSTTKPARFWASADGKPELTPK
jgi:hypothetical protein